MCISFYNSALSVMPVDELRVAGLPVVNPVKLGKDNQVPSPVAASGMSYVSAARGKDVGDRRGMHFTSSHYDVRE